MTLTDLQTMLLSLMTYDNDSYDGESPTTNQQTAVINWALRSIARRLYLYEPKVVFTTANGIQEYDIQSSSYFARKMLDIDRVTVSGTMLNDERGNPGLYSSLDWFDAKNASWRTASSSASISGAVLLGQVLTLDKPTNGVLSNSYVSGRYIPNDLSSGSDVPLIPTECHELIAMLAAAKYTMPTATEQEQWTRLNSMRDGASELLPELYVRQYVSIHGRAPQIVPGTGGGS